MNLCDPMDYGVLRAANDIGSLVRDEWQLHPWWSQGERIGLLADIHNIMTDKADITKKDVDEAYENGWQEAMRKIRSLLPDKAALKQVLIAAIEEIEMAVESEP